jgi:hypothetical protein
MSKDISSYPFSKKNILIRLNNEEQFDKWDKILTKIGAQYNNSDREPGWILCKTKTDLLDEMISKHGSRQQSKRSRNRHFKREEESDEDSIQKHTTNDYVSERSDNRKKHYSDNLETKEAREYSRDKRYEEDSEDDESSSEDDELIQTVLARRLKSESSQKSIQEEDIENSDNEDCISYSRRLRHIYDVIKKQREQISLLENKLKIDN